MPRPFDSSRNLDTPERPADPAVRRANARRISGLFLPYRWRLTAAPVLILAMTSKILTPSALYDAADTVIAQRMSQIDGVAQVEVSGAEQPAIRVRVNPTLLASMGLSMEEVRSAIDAEPRCFTLRLMRRIVPIMFSMMLVQASDRLSSARRPSRVTVKAITAHRQCDALSGHQAIEVQVQTSGLTAARS